ncbi:transcriptional repressor LexA [Gardnerella vaginalis]|uniref:LexA repressor n=1 Tax=Gardnerella vaginalis TaxID=2702 RepID=A0A2K1STG4_GARVA|nr:transcriptional repressor LexA [Gardnerella vaginalis]PNS42851.1 repressor LexA [Gardnerella vaginalis]
MNDESTDQANFATESNAASLTGRQSKIMDAIQQNIAVHGFPPSFREIGELVGLRSTSSVKHQLKALELKGLIRISANKGRAIEVIGHNPVTSSTQRQQSEPLGVDVDMYESESIQTSHDVPLVGRIAAGTPITAEQHIDDVMRLPERLTGTGNLFMLEVHGDSMIDAAICDGDYVVVREQHDACNGDIVAALLDNEATVKTFRNDNGHVWLIPHNPTYSPIDGTNATIMGKVVTVLRKI